MYPIPYLIAWKPYPSQHYFLKYVLYSLYMVVPLPAGHSFIAHQSILNKGLILYLSIKMITSVMWIPPPKKLSHYCVRRETAFKGICGENKVTAICRVGSGVVLHANNNNNVVEIFRFHDSPWLYSTTSTSVTAQSTHAKSISNQQPGREWERCVLSSRDTGLTSWVSKPIWGDSGAVSLGWGDVKDKWKI